ncbi:MAG: hypothetical protein ACKVJU_12045 [Verrucomicrobiales bacterium]
MIKLVPLLLFASFFGGVSCHADEESKVTITGKPPISFLLKIKPKAEITNGKLSVAFTNQNDVIFQVTDLDLEKNEEKKKYLAGSYRLILMNVADSDGALVSPDDEKDGFVLLEQTDSKTWKLSGTGFVVQGPLSYRVDFLTEIGALPTPRFLQAE